MKLAESLLLALKDHGAAEVFGIPGDFALPFFKVLEESKILPLYTLSHEPAVGFAADAAARYRGGLGVVAVTFGAGALNVVNPVAAAYAEKSPLVVVSGAPGLQERGRGLLLHHQAKTIASQTRIFREITCSQVHLTDAETAPLLIAKALRRCLLESRPVYIEIPRDMVNVGCEPVRALPEPAADGDAQAACVDDIMRRLRQAERPVMMVGVETRRFGIEDQVARLGTELGIPVVTSFMGRGLLASSNVPLLGTYLGGAGDPVVAKTVEESDLLLLLGVIPSDTNLGVSERTLHLKRSIIANDGQVAFGFYNYPELPLKDLVAGLLVKAVPLGHGMRAKPTAPLRGCPQDDELVTPKDIATCLNDLMATHGTMPISSDIGDCLFTALDIDHTELVAPGYYATMGYGVPGGIGLQVASGRRPLILVGDGAFQMTGWELGHCRKYGWNPLVVVFNNKSWEMLRAFQPESGFNDLEDWSFAKLADDLGGKGRRVSTRKELVSALEAAVADTSTFQLVEVMLPRGVMSPTLARFAAGFEELRGGG